MRKLSDYVVYYKDGFGDNEAYSVSGVKELREAVKWIHSQAGFVESIYNMGKNFENDCDDVISCYSELCD